MLIGLVEYKTNCCTTNSYSSKCYQFVSEHIQQKYSRFKAISTQGFIFYHNYVFSHSSNYFPPVFPQNLALFSALIPFCPFFPIFSYLNSTFPFGKSEGSFPIRAPTFPKRAPTIRAFVPISYHFSLLFLILPPFPCYSPFLPVFPLFVSFFLSFSSFLPHTFFSLQG